MISGDAVDKDGDQPRRRFSRRRLLVVGAGGLAAVVVAGAAGAELVSHGVLPGKLELDTLDGACSATGPPLVISPALGPTITSSFQSRARNRSVGYTIGYPPGHGPGSELPLIVMLHGFGGDHRNSLSGMQPAQAVAMKVNGQPIAPMAIVTVDGGGGYWTPHPGDDPMSMVVDELIPLCQRMGLGNPPHRIGTMGISMGGYGAILFGEKFPHLISAVASISPAIWATYGEARGANAGAFTSAQAFAEYDAITHTAALVDTPVRIASGDADPFHPGVVALAKALPAGAIVQFATGCHTGAFFTSQEPQSLAFLAQHLGA